jgi:5-methylcytosine-specific restriction protein A
LPSKSKAPCRKVGCRELVVGGGYCPSCRKGEGRRREERRDSSNERGYTSAWRRARKGYLAKHPICRACRDKKDGLIVVATEVDHIIPHRGDKDLFWDSGNWQPLCKPCHSQKTSVENGWGKRR